MPYRGDSYREAPSRLTIFGIGGAILAFVLLVLFLIFKPFVIIDPGQRGVVTRLGQIQNEVMGEGFHWYNSLSSSVHEIDVRTQKADFEGTAGSQDLQIVKFEVAVNYHLNPELVHRTYQQVGDEDAVKERITQPAVQEAVKAATARFTAEQLLTQRDKLKDQIDLALAERLRINNVILDGVSITDIDFSNEFHKQNTAKDGHYFCCKECRKTYSQRDYQKRKEHIKKKVLKYYSENKNNLKIKRRKYQKDRIKTDPEFRIIRNLRNRLYYVLENKMWKKNCSFDKYIGLDNYNDLVLYLESKFQEGMSWDNYGEWEIDHIIPLSSAKSKEGLS